MFGLVVMWLLAKLCFVDVVELIMNVALGPTLGVAGGILLVFAVAVWELGPPILARNIGLIGLGTVGAGLIFNAAEKGGWDSSSTAAWVQGVGSIAAIAALVVIDHGEARRRRSELLGAMSAARKARLHAIRHSETVLRECAGWIDETVRVGSAVAVSEKHRRAISGAHSVLAHHMSIAADVDPRLIGATAEAERLMNVVKDRVGKFGVIVEAVKASHIDQLNHDANAFRALHDDAVEAMRTTLA